MANKTERKTFNFELEVDIDVFKGVIDDEIMDNADRYFADISQDYDYDNIDERRDKHLAYIALQALKGERGVIEGYGSYGKLLDGIDVTLRNVEMED